MIQRIQSIFLLLASGAAFGLLKLPFASTPEAVQASYFADKIYNIQDHIAMLGLFVAAGVLALVSIFLYNNRKLQMQLTRFALIANIIGLILAAVFFMQNAEAIGDAVVNDGLGVYLPVVFVVFGLLALRSIRKDESLVKSMDRLR